MKRWVALVSFAALVGLAIATLAFVRTLGGGSSGTEDLRVDQATLRPNEIVLTIANSSGEAARVAQVIVNDAFVGFRQARLRISPGTSARVTVFYRWVPGEAYDVELMTSSGATLQYEIEDAAAGKVAA